MFKPLFVVVLMLVLAIGQCVVIGWNNRLASHIGMDMESDDETFQLLFKPLYVHVQESGRKWNMVNKEPISQESMVETDLVTDRIAQLKNRLNRYESFCSFEGLPLFMPAVLANHTPRSVFWNNN